MERGLGANVSNDINIYVDPSSDKTLGQHRTSHTTTMKASNFSQVKLRKTVTLDHSTPKLKGTPLLPMNIQSNSQRT